MTRSRASEATITQRQRRSSSGILKSDDWLSQRVGLRCYDLTVASVEEVRRVEGSLAPGSYLTVRSSEPLDLAFPPLVDCMRLLARPNEPMTFPRSNRATTLTLDNTAALGDLMADHFAHRWLRERAFDYQGARRAYRDWGEALPSRSLLVRGIYLNGMLASATALRLIAVDLVVDPIVTNSAFRSQGLATEILYDLLSMTPRKRAMVSAWVSESNEPSLRVFRKAGFEQVGTRYLYAGKIPTTRSA
jgi:RimJ/RimL family protein N-acetyltransferase